MAETAPKEAFWSACSIGSELTSGVSARSNDSGFVDGSDWNDLSMYEALSDGFTTSMHDLPPLWTSTKKRDRWTCVVSSCHHKVNTIGDLVTHLHRAHDQNICTHCWNLTDFLSKHQGCEQYCLCPVDVLTPCARHLFVYNVCKTRSPNKPQNPAEALKFISRLVNSPDSAKLLNDVSGEGEDLQRSKAEILAENSTVHSDNVALKSRVSLMEEELHNLQKRLGRCEHNSPARESNQTATWNTDHEPCGAQHYPERREPPQEIDQAFKATMFGPPKNSLHHETIELFAQAQADLKLLELGIDSLEGGSDSESEESQSDGEIALTRHASPETKIGSGPLSAPSDVRKRAASNGDDRENIRPSSDSSHATVSSISPNEFSGSSGRRGQKRKRTDDSSDDHPGAKVTTSEESQVPGNTSKRLICCFHNEPDRNCPGTDERISDVIQSSSQHHNAHICTRCWELKSKDHPDDCDDYCLSPRCLRTSPGFAHKHRFDQNVCRTKTSRPRPEDRESIFRYIYRLIHPTVEVPEVVYTEVDECHLGENPRQRISKPSYAELRKVANGLRVQLEELQKKHDLKDDEVHRMKRELADAKSNMEKERDKVALDMARGRDKITDIEARTRRIIDMLGDALCIGTFRDGPVHTSLLRRVKEDAPKALDYLPQSLLTPPASNVSQQSSTSPSYKEVSTPESVHRSQDACNRATGQEASLFQDPGCVGTTNHDAIQEHVPARRSDRHEINDGHGNKLDPRMSTAQPMYTTSQERPSSDFRAGTTTKGIETDSDNAQSTKNHSAGMDLPNMMVDTSRPQGKGVDAPGADFPDFDFGNLNSGNFDFLAWPECTLPDGFMADASATLNAYDGQMQGDRL